MTLRIYDAEYGEHTIYLALSQKELEGRFGSMAAFVRQVAERYDVDMAAEDARERLVVLLSDSSVPLLDEHPYVLVRQGSTVADSRVSQAAFAAFAGAKGAEGAEAATAPGSVSGEGIDITTPVLLNSIRDAGGDFGLCKKRLTYAHRWPLWKTQSAANRAAMISELPVDDAQEIWNSSLAGGATNEDDLGNWIGQLSELSTSSPPQTIDSTVPTARSSLASPSTAPAT